MIQDKCGEIFKTYDDFNKELLKYTGHVKIPCMKKMQLLFRITNKKSSSRTFDDDYVNTTYSILQRDQAFERQSLVPSPIAFVICPIYTKILPQLLNADDYQLRASRTCTTTWRLKFRFMSSSGSSRINKRST